MRIAFDLDGTLIPIGENQFPIFFVPLPMRLFFREPIRQGTRELMKILHEQGHDLWVYTSSFRSKWYIWFFFRALGVKLKGVVNGDVHAKLRHHHTSTPSKFPPAFDIDILIDDSLGVEMEGKKHGFQVLMFVRVI